MRDLSLHILDLAQNSVTADAKHVDISVILGADGWLEMTIRDDGKGMSPELLARVTSPFGTTRTTRKVGLGIPLMMQNARLTGGDVILESRVGEGTVLTVSLNTASIDCLPLGDLAGTMVTLIGANPEKPEFSLTCRSPQGEMSFSTVQVREILQGVRLNEPEVSAWMLSSMREEIQPIFGGVIL